MPAPLDPEKRQSIEAAIKAGRPRNAIARDHDVAGSTVGKIAKQLAERGDLDAPAFDRSQTKKATAALVSDAKELRATLARSALSTARDVLGSLAVEDWSKVSPYSRAIVFGILVERGIDLGREDDSLTEAASLLGDLVADVRERRRAAE